MTINQDKIDEWVREIEERPLSAPIILRYIASRLIDLTSQTEELRAENYALRSGSRVEDYERRIANLEYQIALLKRQVSGQAEEAMDGRVNLIVYNQEGQALRVELLAAELVANQRVAVLKTGAHSNKAPVRMLVAGLHEELLFVFDSGRTATAVVTAIPAVTGNDLDWKHAHLQMPVGGEKLVVVAPVARMSLVESIVQSTLRGWVKRMMPSFFASQVAKNYIGAGVKLQPDKTSGLTLCGKQHLFVMASREGHLFSIDPARLPYAIEEAMKLRATDTIISSFAVANHESIAAVTTNGKVIQRDFAWIEPAVSLNSKRQALFSQARRDAGIKVAAAGSVREGDWGAALHADGNITLHTMSDLFAAGKLSALEEQAEIVDFVVFAAPGSEQG